MSWSVSMSGKPAEVVRKLRETSYTGDSKVEFDAALPHLVGLVEQNHAERTVSLTASGHGVENRECRVNLQ